MKQLKCMLAGSALILATPVAAQITDYPLSPIQFPSALNFNAAAQIGVVYGIEYDNGDEPQGGDFVAPVPPADFDADIFAYEPNAERSRANIRSFIARSRATNPSAAQELEMIFETQPTLLQDFGQAITAFGLDAHNVADAYTLWWMSVWLAANQRTDTPSLATFAAVQEQAQAAFWSTEDYASTSDAEKQQFAEALIVQSIILNTVLEQAKDQPQVLSELAKMARKGAKDSGLDLSLMTLTEAGFVPREGADATDAVSAPDTAPPAAAPSDLPILLAVASLAGFGMGSAYWIGKRG